MIIKNRTLNITKKKANRGNKPKKCFQTEIISEEELKIKLQRVREDLKQNQNNLLHLNSLKHKSQIFEHLKDKINLYKKSNEMVMSANTKKVLSTINNIKKLQMKQSIMNKSKLNKSVRKRFKRIVPSFTTTKSDNNILRKSMDDKTVSSNLKNDLSDIKIKHKNIRLISKDINSYDNENNFQNEIKNISKKINFGNK